MKIFHLAACGASAVLFALSAVAQTQSQPSTPSAQPSTPSAQPSTPSAQPGGPASTQRGAASSGASTARGSVPVQQNQTRKQKFDQLDSNKDGRISRQEAEASPELVIIFIESDTNSDNSLSPTEFEVVPLVQPDGTSVK
jgi:hypothetical protein